MVMIQHQAATNDAATNKIARDNFARACQLVKPVSAIQFLAIMAWLMIGVGCDSSKQSQTSSSPNASTSASGKSQVLANSANPQAEIQALLDQAGVKLSTNAKSGVIESADFSRVEMSDMLAEELAKVDSLVQLVIRQSSLTDAGWSSLSQLHGLQNLDLRECPIGDQQLVTLTTSMLKLRSVRLNGKLGNCDVTDAGTEFLKNQDQLKLLALDGVKIGSRTVAQIENCKSLSELYLAGTMVDDAGLASLSQLSELKKLRLAQTEVSSVGLASVAGLSLEELDLSECSKIDDAALTTLGKLTTLKRLNLWSTLVTDAGTQHLSQLARLQWLNLDNTKITDASLPQLRNLGELSFLHLGSTSVSDAGLPELQSLKALKKLIVTRTQVTQAGVDALQKLMPAVDIQLQYVAGK